MALWELLPDPDTRVFSPAHWEGTPKRWFYTGGDPERAISIGDLRARAHQLMPRFVLEYLEGGAGEEATLARDRKAFADWRFVPHTLTGSGTAFVSQRLMGLQATLPLAVAPTGLNGLFMRNADMALAGAAAQFRVPFIQSTMSNVRMEEIGQISNLRHWWQLYVFGGDEIWQELLHRADASGCEALVLTTNAQVYGQREWDSRTRIRNSKPSLSTLADAALHPRWARSTLTHGMPVFENVIDFVPKSKRGFFESAFWIREQMKKSLSWKDVERIRSRWHKPLFVKGILHPDDVRAAMDSGVDGVILGGHGGRQADWAISALDVLPQARAIMGQDKHLYMSGGIRRGTDILKALALGADAVLAGRSMLYGLCAYGEAGVRRALEILQEETSNELAQLGLSSLDMLSRDIIVPTRDLPLAPVAAQATG